MLYKVLRMAVTAHKWAVVHADVNKKGVPGAGDSAENGGYYGVWRRCTTFLYDHDR